MGSRFVPISRDVIRRNAQSHFEQAEARTTTVRKMAEDERKAVDAKTAKLRALRLAKEEEDRLKNAGVLQPSPKTS